MSSQAAPQVQCSAEPTEIFFTVQLPSGGISPAQARADDVSGSLGEWLFVVDETGVRIAD